MLTGNDTEGRAAVVSKRYRVPFVRSELTEGFAATTVALPLKYCF